MGLETTFYPFRAMIARQPNPAYAWASRYGSTMVNGPIYETGSIGWAKGGHGLAHTDLIFDSQHTDLLLAQNGACWDHALINISPKGYQQSTG